MSKNLEEQYKQAKNETDKNRVIDIAYKAMIEVPGSKIPKLDFVLCNKNYNDQNISNYEGIQCSNYRAIDVNGIKYYLRVSTIDLDNPKSGIDYADFIKTKCNQEGVVNDFLKKGLLEKDTTIYFKGAYVIYPTNWVQEKEIPDSTKFDIFKQAAKTIFLNIFPYLQKIGIKTIVVDPEPGYHPKTLLKSQEEKIEGLIKLYEGMGLKKVNCLYRTSGMELLNFMSDLDIRQQIGKDNLDKDIIVMIGSVDEMMEKINTAKSIISNRFLGFIGSMISDEIRELKEFYEANIPFKFYPDLGNLSSILTESTIDDLRKNEDLKFKQKYLKYKQKYLELKKLKL